MNINPLFRSTSTAFKFSLFLILVLFGAILGMLTGMLISHFTYGIPINEISIAMQTPGSLSVARSMQISSQIGIFLLPPLFYAWLTASKPLQWLGFRDIKTPQILLPALILMFVSLPLIHGLGNLNQSLSLPEWLSGFENWMQDKENQAEILTERFLKAEGIGALAINLIMIGILPSIGEELVFRSVLQPSLSKLFNNIHIGVVISAVLFSMMHMQFYGFLPRLALGLFLGYFYYWSGSIWIPVLMHLANNGTAVVVYYLHHNGLMNISMDEFGTTDSMPWIVLSIVVSGILLWMGYQLQQSAGKKVE